MPVRYLGGMDTMFVRAETRSMLLHVAGVLVLDPRALAVGDPREAVRDLIATRLRDLPPLRWRLIEPPGGLGSLRWIDDPDFDLDQHVRLGTVPAPGGRAELEQILARVAAAPLDRHRPLWEMDIVDGLADGSLAIVSKFHHAFMDGGAGMELLGSLFDLTPDAPHGADHEPRPTEPVPTAWRLLADTPGEVVDRIRRVPSAVRSTIAGASGLVGAMFPGGGDGDGVSHAHRSSFNGPLTGERIVALADCSLTQVKQIKTAFGVTVNDVVLAAVTSSLRSRLVAEDTLERGPLVAAVPISVRSPDLADGYGNHTSAMMVPLPTDLADPVERLMAIHHFTIGTKERHQAMGPNLLELWAGLIPPWLISAGSNLVGRFAIPGRLPPVFNVIVSNVAGPPVPIYLAGAELIAMYPLGPLLEGVGMNITVLSHRDTLHIGIIGDPTLVSHPSLVADGITAAIDELVHLSAQADPADAGAR